MTFSGFVTDVRATVFPEGAAENLLANYRKYIVDALIDLQQKIPGLQTKHRDNYTQNETLFDCGASVFPAPRGFIQTLHTLDQDDCCTRVWYEPVSKDEMRCLLVDQEACGTTYRAYGFYEEYDVYYAYSYIGECGIYTDAGTDKPCRAAQGQFSLVDGNIYVYPHIQSTEIIVLEWDGLKRAWDDTDTVDFDREVQDAVEMYLEAKTRRREDCDREAMLAARAAYDEKVAMLIWQDRKEKRIPRRQACFSNCGPCFPTCD